jgi:predicted DNA-binding transcriptional regulator AlpA
MARIDLADVRVSVPPPRRQSGGEWDWYHALAFGDRMFVRRFMVSGGTSPDDLATQLGQDIDATMARWIDSLRAERGIGGFGDVDDVWDNFAVVDDLSELVGPGEVAELLGVKAPTVHQWRHRGLMPDVVAVLTSTPIWRRSDVEAWARDTGRLS